MKDYHDLLLLVRNKQLIELKKLEKALTKTFENRGTSLSAIQFEAEGLASLQKLWTAHYHGLGDIARELDLPKNIETVIDEINIPGSVQKSGAAKEAPWFWVRRSRRLKHQLRKVGRRGPR
jgi:hypothetical protein